MQKTTYNEVQEAYNNLLNLTPKEKYKKIRSVAALAENALKNVSDIKELVLYSEIFKLADNSRLLNKAKSKELELKGISKIKTLKTKLGSVNIESGLISVGDPSLGYTGEYNKDEVIKSMNQNRFYCVDTGGDGIFDITLRVVDIDEPLLGPKEYNFIISTSKTSVINIRSGIIKCSDFWDLSNKEVPGISYELDNGYYKVAFYLKVIRDKYFGFVVVLCKTNSLDFEELVDIENLG